MLAFWELSDRLENSPEPSRSEDLSTWHKNDAKAKALIELYLFNEHLEHVRNVNTAYGMCITIKNIFQRRILVNPLNAKQKFYSPEMAHDERVILYINRAKQLCTNLKVMNKAVTGQELAMNVYVVFLVGMSI